MHRISLWRSNTAVVDFGYGERKSSADAELNTQNILHAKNECPGFSKTKERSDKIAALDIAKRENRTITNILYKMNILRCVQHHTGDTLHFTVEKQHSGSGFWI